MSSQELFKRSLIVYCTLTALCLKLVDCYMKNEGHFRGPHTYKAHRDYGMDYIYSIMLRKNMWNMYCADIVLYLSDFSLVEIRLFLANWIARFGSGPLKGARTPEVQMPPLTPYLIDHIFGATITLILLFASLFY